MKTYKVGSLNFAILDKPTYQNEDTLTKHYWHFHPRFRFFKCVPRNCKLLDIGAGSGGLSFWKDWSFPQRTDIRMYAIDLVKGEYFDRYEDFQIINLDHEDMKFSNNEFDAVIMSHVIEHLTNPDHVLREIYRVLKPGAKAYFELPTPETISFPRQKEFMEQGINVTTVNFFDDLTHIRTYTMDQLQSLMKDHKFTILESGIIQNNFLEHELFTYGVNMNDQPLTSYGVWSLLRWAQYIIVEKH